MLVFGEAAIDIPRREVIVDGEARHLEPQAFDLLAYLVEHRDRVVPKTELLDQVWGDQFVSESALTTRVKEIRRALGDDGTRQAFVRNFRGRGYRFIAAPSSGSPESRSVPTGARSDLVGRDGDVAAAFEALQRSRLVTLVGPGGVGKTTLAREVARTAPAQWPQALEVREVELAAVRDDAGLRHAFERGCGIVDRALDHDGLALAISDLDSLVVVDNCEHVVGDVAGLVDAILRRNGPVRILATSRERLGVPGEHVVHVEPLDAEAARELLVARSRAADDRVVIDHGDTAVEHLLAMLDHLPLAIEMAAARIASMGIGELVDVLGERLDLLRSANRGADARHRTLVEVIEWSERLLDPDVRRLLHDLSVFAGPATAGDIGSVTGTSASELTLGPLSELVERSLVVADGTEWPTRYRLLATVRAVVAQRRDPTVEERHARHAVAAVQEADRRLRGPDERGGVERIMSLEHEIGAAHRWARRHDHALAARLTSSLLHYSHERLWSEPAAWARAALADPMLTVDSRPFAAAVAADASNHDDVHVAIELASTATDSDDPLVAASAHDTIANVGMYTGDLTLCIDHGMAQTELGERIGDSTMRTFGRVNDVLARVYAGDLVAARRSFVARTTDLPLSVTSEAWLAYGEGELLAAEGDDPAALDRFRRAVELGMSVDNPFVVGVAQVAELAARARTGDIVEAIHAFESVLVRHRRTHNTTHAITALRNLIVLLVREERDEPAMRLFGALSGPDVKATYGAESEDLIAARSAAEVRRGSERVDGWIAEGRGHTVGWALDLAIELLSAPSNA